MKTFTIKNKGFKKIISFIFWIFVWTLLSTIVDNNVLLPDPYNVFIKLAELLGRNNFWSSIFNSISKIGLGLVIGIIVGIILATISYNLSSLKSIIDLPINLISATPVASITILLLIWISSINLSVIIVFLIVLPTIYNATLSAFDNVDYKLIEMAQVFKVSRFKKVKYIYLDRLKEFILPSIITSVGLAWKSGISAEVLGLVGKSIGENIYYAKLYLNTAELFAWTIIIVILAKLFEHVITEIIIRVI